MFRGQTCCPDSWPLLKHKTELGEYTPITNTRQTRIPSLTPCTHLTDPNNATTKVHYKMTVILKA